MMDNALAMRQTIFIVLHHRQQYQLNRGQIRQVNIVCLCSTGYDYEWSLNFVT